MVHQPAAVQFIDVILGNAVPTFFILELLLLLEPLRIRKAVIQVVPVAVRSSREQPRFSIKLWEVSSQDDKD